MEQNPSAAGHNRKPLPRSPPVANQILKAATQKQQQPSYHQPSPPLQPAYLYSQMPENPMAAPQGFLPYYHPNSTGPHQFFRGFQSNAGGGFGAGGNGLPPPTEEELKGFVPAAAARSSVQQNQEESGQPFGKPLAKNKEAKALESRKAALMGELEAMCRNASPAAAVPPSSGGTTEPNAGGFSDSEDEEIKEEDVAEFKAYMEEAVKQLMICQQTLYSNFIEKLEKMDQKRRAMDEEWMQMEMERIELMATFKEKDRAIAAEREEIIFAYLEKVTGQTLPLQPRKPPQKLASPRSSDQRWPDVEVGKLIEIRTGLELRFNRSGCKLSLWEEISRLMAEAGFQRTAMRCKEKWENINKYFKRLKKNSSPRKRAKTCPYYDKLDQLYSSGCSTSDANGSGRTDLASEIIKPPQ